MRRLACYGWVKEHGGSCGSANHLVLAELLRRGVGVDLYAHRNHVPCPESLTCENFRYFGFDQPAWLDAVDRTGQVAAGVARRLLHPLGARSWRRIFQPAVELEHRQAPYDAVLSLGITPAFELDGVPAISWLQSPPHTELEAIRRLRGPIKAINGRAFYLGLVSLYRYTGFVFPRVALRSDRIVLGSNWSCEAMIERGGNAATLHALPYPIDLDTFQPRGEQAIDWDRPVLLSLGRLDPRKRLDLLLDAFATLKQDLPGARLKIVGRPGYYPRQLSLLEHLPTDSGVDYSPHVPRDQVPALLREAAVLVQTSENENFGSSPAEALACGTPVVVGPSNGTGCYIDGNSAVFDAYAPESVARAILDTLQTRRTRSEEVRRTTRESAERWFAPATVVDRLLEIIDVAIAERAGDTPQRGRSPAITMDIQTSGARPAPWNSISVKPASRSAADNDTLLQNLMWPPCSRAPMCSSNRPARAISMFLR